MNKTYYSFSRMNGVYTGVGFAPEDPEQPGVFMLPAFATFDAPPVTGANQVAVWGGSAWVIDELAPTSAPAAPQLKGARWRVWVGTRLIHYAIMLAAKISPDIRPATQADLEKLGGGH